MRLGGAVDDDNSNLLVAQLLYLDSIGKKDITMYVNSPGGSVTAGGLLPHYHSYGGFWRCRACVSKRTPACTDAVTVVCSGWTCIAASDASVLEAAVQHLLQCSAVPQQQALSALYSDSLPAEASVWNCLLVTIAHELEQSLAIIAVRPDVALTALCSCMLLSGCVHAGMAVFDTMRYIKSDVSTVCVGLAASMGAFILASGQKVCHSQI